MDKGTDKELLQQRQRVEELLKEVNETQSDILDLLNRNLNLQIKNEEQYEVFVETVTQLIKSEHLRLKLELVNTAILFTVGLFLFYCIVHGVI
ncbi:hypothetical protein [Megasphaera stantonii]|uniref:hypothetical protein n=1 Tax=Megasphaera stantonii TaxID=2144175 RepID=UPI002943DB09|nr:hypothetical protein [Megasphaera stantonii]